MVKEESSKLLAEHKKHKEKKHKERKHKDNDPDREHRKRRKHGGEDEEDTHHRKHKHRKKEKEKHRDRVGEDKMGIIDDDMKDNDLWREEDITMDGERVRFDYILLLVSLNSCNSDHCNRHSNKRKSQNYFAS